MVFIPVLNSIYSRCLCGDIGGGLFSFQSPLGREFSENSFSRGGVCVIILAGDWRGVSEDRQRMVKKSARSEIPATLTLPCNRSLAVGRGIGRGSDQKSPPVVRGSWQGFQRFRKRSLRYCPGGEGAGFDID